jgi:hypothetical protein
VVLCTIYLYEIIILITIFVSHTIWTIKMDDALDQELRLKCIEFVTRQETYVTSSPILHMIHAQMLFRYIKTGTLPIISYPDANKFTDDLLQKSLDLMIEERKQCEQPNETADQNPQALNFLEALVPSFCSKLRFKKTV